MLWCIYSGNKLEIRRRGNSLLIYRKTIIYNYFAFKSENKHSCCLRLLIWLLKCWPFSAEWAKGTSTALRQQRAILFCWGDSGEERTGLAFRTWLNPCVSACFQRVTFYLTCSPLGSHSQSELGTNELWVCAAGELYLSCWESSQSLFSPCFHLLPPLSTAKTSHLLVTAQELR